MICIYHSIDLDGWCSAAIVKLARPECKFIGYNYGQPIPEFTDSTEELVFVDISLPMSEFLKLYQRGHKITWIDHHISAINDYKQFIGDGETFMFTSHSPLYAACELTWTYFFGDKQMPELVRLLGRYDCFGHKGTDEEQKVLDFQYGARSIISNMEECYRELNDNIHCDHTENAILQMGKGIYKFLCTDARQSYKNSFVIDFDGYKFITVNKERFNPINFGIDYHKEGYDGAACFHYANGKWNFSLYNDNGLIDCSIICKKRGGGGHKGASGFVTTDINSTIG
jgi:uncharacterized protein